jgi:hypothetical protein
VSKNIENNNKVKETKNSFDFTFNRQKTIENGRKYLFAATNKAPPPLFYFHVRFCQHNERKKKGFFVDGASVTNILETTVCPAKLLTLANGQENDSIGKFTVERSFSEFKTLFSKLGKDFPLLFIPPLPVKKILRQKNSLADNNTENTNLNENNEQERSSVEIKEDRYCHSMQLCIWLQFVSCIKQIQTSLVFLQFVTGENTLQSTNFSSFSNAQYKNDLLEAFSARFNSNSIINCSRDTLVFMRIFHLCRKNDREENNDSFDINDISREVKTLHPENCASLAKRNYLFRDLQIVNRFFICMFIF